MGVIFREAADPITLRERGLLKFPLRKKLHWRATFKQDSEAEKLRNGYMNNEGRSTMAAYWMSGFITSL